MIYSFLFSSKNSIHMLGEREREYHQFRAYFYSMHIIGDLCLWLFGTSLQLISFSDQFFLAISYIYYQSINIFFKVCILYCFFLFLRVPPVKLFFQQSIELIDLKRLQKSALKYLHCCMRYKKLM